MDAQLEATYEGPEAVQRWQLSITMTNELFLAQFQQWISEMRQLASERPGTGACTLGHGHETLALDAATPAKRNDADGPKLYHEQRQGVTFPMADALCWLLAARCQHARSSSSSKQRRPRTRRSPTGCRASCSSSRDLCARAVGARRRRSRPHLRRAVFGYNRHPQWQDCKACFHAEHVAHLEQTMPGIEGFAMAIGEVVERDGSHAPKAGPCVRFSGFEVFEVKRQRLDGCMVESHLAKDRAAKSLAAVAIPDALDYPR